LRFLIAPAVF